MKLIFRRIFIGLLTLFSLTANSQNKVIPADAYKASATPDSLKEGANSVIRYAYNTIEVKAPGKAVISRHKIVTILNEKAEDDAILYLNYNKKYISVNTAELIAYNADGSLIKRYKKSDMYDGSATDGFSIITDERFLATKHNIARYPITIETITELRLSSLITLPDWVIQQPEQSVQYSEYFISVNPAVGFRYKPKNITISPQVGKRDDMDTYTWKITHKKAIKPEEKSAYWRVLPRVSFASNSFEYYGIPGNMNSWQDYGKWFFDLNTGANNLSLERVQEIRKMTDTIPGDKEKAKFLYQYLQKNTRYVSIQLGLGGLKPFPATFVEQNKYGDCKALSNYMQSLLAAVNIPSYYALVNAGTNAEPADLAFTDDPFNHVILCIPFKNDTTWLECTSTTQPFGKLGPFTENRNALLITKDGGLLTQTPASKMEDHQFNSEVNIKLSETGEATATLKIKSTGDYRSMYTSLATEKITDQKEYLIKSLNLKPPHSLELTHNSDQNGVKEIDIVLEYDQLSDIITGNKHFYKPYLFDLWKFTLPAIAKRQTDLYFDHPMQKSSITNIDLPDGFEVESLPTNVSLKFSYGNFESTYAYNAVKKQVNVITKFNLTNHVIPAEKYKEAQQYLDDITKAQNKKLIIRKKP